MIIRRIALLRGRMRAIRFHTALGLMLTGVLLLTAQFVLLSHPTLTSPGLAVTSDANHGGAQGGGADGCHEESAPRDQAPANHDCCTVGHLHAIGSAWSNIAPRFAVSPISSSLIQSATIDQTASQSTQFSDTGPPGSAVPIRI